MDVFIEENWSNIKRLIESEWKKESQTWKKHNGFSNRTQKPTNNSTEPAPTFIEKLFSIFLSCCSYSW